MEEDEELSRARSPATAREAHQGDQRPRDRHLSRQGRPLPNRAGHRIELGTRLLKADLVEEAIAELQQAKRDEKLKWKAAMLLGMSFKKRNNWRLAQRTSRMRWRPSRLTDEPAQKELLYQLASGCAENGDLPRAIDLGHELANLDFSFKNIGKLLDEWNDRMQSA